MRVLIVSGGNTSERKISLISAKAVKAALEKNGYQVRLFDFKKGNQQLKIALRDCDVVFPVLHGAEGEGGTLQKTLTRFKKPFVGGDFKGFQKGWYKIPFKKFCNQEKIPTARWKIIKSKADILRFGFPAVLKASSGGSSREVIIIKNEKDLNKSADNLLKQNDQFFVEEFLSGPEVTVGILDNKALPVLEIIPPQGKWFDYQNKYSGATREIPHAPSLTEKQRQLVQQTAIALHCNLNLGHYSRIDFIVSNGQPYVLEINTIPGLTPNSLFPKAAKIAGLEFHQLVEKLTRLALSKSSP